MPKETNKEKALAALLESSSIAEAAKKSGLSDKTLRRFLQEPEFKKEYRAARKLLLEENILAMQDLSRTAIETLTNSLTCENPAVALRAAMFVVEQTRRDFETNDILERLEVLEDEIAVKDKTN